jgi:hypothetical protein
MNKQQMQVYKSTDNNKTTYYYYTEKKVYVTTHANVCALNIIFGTIWICGCLSKWYFIGASFYNFFDIWDLLLVILWLFLIKYNFHMLLLNPYKVQVLKKTVIEDKDGNKIENCF